MLVWGPYEHPDKVQARPHRGSQGPERWAPPSEGPGLWEPLILCLGLECLGRAGTAGEGPGGAKHGRRAKAGRQEGRQASAGCAQSSAGLGQWHRRGSPPTQLPEHSLVVLMPCHTHTVTCTTHTHDTYTMYALTRMTCTHVCAHSHVHIPCTHVHTHRLTLSPSAASLSRNQAALQRHPCTVSWALFPDTRLWQGLDKGPGGSCPAEEGRHCQARHPSVRALMEMFS